MAWRARFLIVGVFTAAIGINLFLEPASWLGYGAAVMSLIISGLSFHIVTLQPAQSLDLKRIIQIYITLAVYRVVGFFNLRKVKSTCGDVELAQKTTLMRILRRGETTVYGCDHNLADITTVEEFRTRMPLTEYADYKKYIERCLSGEKNVFFQEDVNFYATTSGTTSGKSKYYPVNTSMNATMTGLNYVLSYSTLLTAIPQNVRLVYTQNFWVPGRLQKVENGIEKGSVSTKLLRTEPSSCAPTEVYKIYDERSGYYVQMLFTLREPEVSVIMTMTSSILLTLFAMVETEWERLVRDIRRGELDADLDIPDDIRSTLNSLLTPNPRRADELSTIFKSGFKEIVPKIWPKLSGTACLCTGPFALQAKVFQELYVGPDIPMYASLHMSTEANYGILLFDEGLVDPRTGTVRDDFMIAYNDNFCEFIPAERTEEEQPDTVLAHQVEIGRDYELVVTTMRGLYRFRSGDLVRIAGYKGNVPRYRVLQRVGDVLNVNLEKLPEVVLAEAVQEASMSWASGKLINFAATENVNIDAQNDKGLDKLYYYIFVAIDTNKPLDIEEKQKIDETLRAISDSYRAYRTKGTICPPRIVQVRPESFEKLRDLASEKNPLLYRLQYKHPRIIRDQRKLQMLIDSEI